MPDSDATTLPLKDRITDRLLRLVDQYSNWQGPDCRDVTDEILAMVAEQSQDELCTFTLPDGGPCNLSGSHNVHTLLGGSLQHLFRPATSQAKGLITDVAAEIEQIGGAYYADDVAEILRRLADGKKPDFLPAPHSAGLVKIVVNMVEHEVPLATTISYEQVAELAGKPGATHLTMTHHTSKYGGGSLIAGESTRLRAGMHFTAVSSRVTHRWLTI